MAAETTPNTAAPVGEAYMARQACAFCNERRPLYKSASDSDKYVCGFHHAVSLSLLDRPSADEASGIGAAATVATRPTRTPGSECVLGCGNRVTVSSSGSRCAVGHALCADCTAQYAEKTLMPQGTVWWDRIKCVGPECEAYLLGTSVQRCLGRGLMERIDAAQLEVVPSIGPEARRERERAAKAARRAAEVARRAAAAEARRVEEDASKVTVVRTTRPCPNCGVPIEKNGGCRHMRCTRCNQRYNW